VVAGQLYVNPAAAAAAVAAGLIGVDLHHLPNCKAAVLQPLQEQLLRLLP
jgi:hypothetical protein